MNFIRIEELRVILAFLLFDRWKLMFSFWNIVCSCCSLNPIVESHSTNFHGNGNECLSFSEDHWIWSLFRFGYYTFYRFAWLRLLRCKFLKDGESFDYALLFTFLLLETKRFKNILVPLVLINEDKKVLKIH